jgi:hypothetical protein
MGRVTKEESERSSADLSGNLRGVIVSIAAGTAIGAFWVILCLAFSDELLRSLVLVGVPRGIAGLITIPFALLAPFGPCWATLSIVDRVKGDAGLFLLVGGVATFIPGAFLGRPLYDRWGPTVIAWFSNLPPSLLGISAIIGLASGIASLWLAVLTWLPRPKDP